MIKKTTQNNKENKGKVLSGVVVSDKMKDTVVVEVRSYQKHPKYQKYIKSRKKYKAHDAGNTLNIGDKVEIIETRPISKDKRFKLLKLIAKAPAVLTEEIIDIKE
jgi:small subunit ribosomal protein S17